jgi:very-short-patch-repair endonuclease
VLIPEWRAIVEADSRRWHTRVADFERDRQRDNEAVVHGYRPVRFTWHALNHEVDRVLAALEGLRRLADDDRRRAA